MRAWLLLAAMLLLVPAAQAAMTATAVVEGPRPIVPEIDTAVLKVGVTIPCEDVRLHVPEAGDAVLHVTPRSPEPNVILAGREDVPLPLSSCRTDPTGTVEVDVEFHVSITRQAPGLVLFPIDIAVRLDADRLAPALDANTSTAVVSGYYPLVSVRLPQKIIEVAPGEDAEFVFEVGNFGNAQTTLVATLAKPLEDDGLSLVPIDPLVVEPGKNATTRVTVHAAPATGLRNREAAVQLVWTPHATKDASLVGDAVTANLLVRIRSASLANLPGEDADAAPSVGPLLAVALLGAALLARARLK